MSYSPNMFAAGGSGTVTSVSGAGTVAGLTLTGTVVAAGSITLGGTLTVTGSDFGSQLQNRVLASPDGAAGSPTFRKLLLADFPTQANATILGNNTGGVSTPIALTSGQVKTLLAITSADLSDFNSATRAQTEAELVAGANITITPSGAGATRQLTIAASGGGGATYGTATINFGAFPGSNEAVVAFADAGVLAGSKVSAFVSANDTTADHTANDHRYAAMFMGLSAAPTAGVGGNIYARSMEKLQGTFAVRWAWS